MNEILPIPSPDPIAVPGDIGLILFLLYLTFFIHVVLMNVMLGGIFLTFVSELVSRLTKDGAVRENHIHLAEKMGHILPFSVSLTVTFGIAPLLFVQSIYGQFFYTSSVLMATIWLSVVLLIVIGYYSLYAYTRGFEKWANRRYLFMGLSFVMFATIAFIYTNNLTLMQTPQKWLEIYTRTNGSGWHWNMDEATLIPRYLHFLFSSFAVAGLLVTILGVREADVNRSGFMKKWGGLWFVVATLANVAVGFAFYFAIPEGPRAIFGGSEHLNFTIAHIMFFVGLVCISLTAFGKVKPAVTWIGVVATFVGIAEKIVARDHLRQAYLKEVNWTLDGLKTNPQTDVILLFFAFLIVGTGAMVWGIVKLRKELKAHATK